jgi:hypothetical protein
MPIDSSNVTIGKMDEATTAICMAKLMEHTKPGGWIHETAKAKLHGGTRPGAGRRSTWSTNETETIRIPSHLKEAILKYAHQLDATDF